MTTWTQRTLDEALLDKRSKNLRRYEAYVNDMLDKQAEAKRKGKKIPKCYSQEEWVRNGCP